MSGCACLPRVSQAVAKHVSGRLARATGRASVPLVGLRGEHLGGHVVEADVGRPSFAALLVFYVCHADVAASSAVVDRVQ
jgi:hypothetical protein